uniref:Uncharacterized protein n=1 Tax=Cyanothece sp. (strain PCC 7425 / ATCC 29141) TaxID=395961 RepID=B8HYY9_CYAP4
MTLNKANRLLQQLKNRRTLRHIDYLATQTTFKLEVRLSDCNNNLKATLEDQQQRRQQSLDQRIQICEDYYLLKEALFAANQRSGVSQRLSEVEKCRELLNLYQSIRGSFSSGSTVPLRVEDIDPEQLREDLKHMDGITELAIQVVGIEEIGQQMQDLTARIDRRMRLPT